MNIEGWFPLGLTGLNLLAVQGTLKSLLQHHSTKASILRRSAFFTVQLSHPYMTTGKTIALEKVNSCPNADSSTDDHGAKRGSFRGAEVEGEATCRGSTVSPDSHLFLSFLFSTGGELTSKAVTVSGGQWRDSALHVDRSTLPHTPLPRRPPHNPQQSSLCATVGPCWFSISHTL